MCNIWKYPSLPKEEITLETLAKLPDAQSTINLTGGEPTLREDLPEIVDLLYPKTSCLEISSNGLKPQIIEPIIKKYPNIKIRFSLEGFEMTNNLIRGEKNGFQTKVDGLIRLREIGGKDLGFAMTIQDDNAAEVVDIFRFAQQNGFELSTSTLHNGFQFHKSDNYPYDRLQIARFIERLIEEQLKTTNIKNWFRAYLDLGLLAKVLGNPRILPCTVGYDSAFVDPWGDVYACNVRPDLKMGNLKDQSWEEIFYGPLAEEVRRKVDACKHNCWMVGSAKVAMRNPKNPRLPRWKPVAWVVLNKLILMGGGKINFKKYINYNIQFPTQNIQKREFFLDQPGTRQIQSFEEEPYKQFGDYFNQ